jgi:hypothetical protein
MWLHNLFSRKRYKKGDVIYADRGFYKHYGIYMGNSSVIHFANKESLFSPITVRETSLIDFAKDCTVSVETYSRKLCLSPHETMRRARSRLRKTDYNIVFNNCEHFARWCKTGQRKSVQVQKVCALLNMVNPPLDFFEELKAGGVETIIMYLDEAFDDLKNGFSDWLDSLN